MRTLGVALQLARSSIGNPRNVDVRRLDQPPASFLGPPPSDLMANVTIPRQTELIEAPVLMTPLGTRSELIRKHAGVVQLYVPIVVSAKQPDLNAHGTHLRALSRARL